MTFLPHVALTGKARAGKDTAGRHLVEAYGYTRVAFADGVREVALAIDPIVGRRRGTADPWRLSEEVELLGWETAKRNPEVRRLLQVIGTEAGRRHFGEHVWIDLAMRKVEAIDGPVVFTDCRFPNEADAVAALGGLVVRIERKGAGFDTAHGQHPSEVALDCYPHDDIVANDGTIEELHAALDEIVAP